MEELDIFEINGGDEDVEDNERHLLKISVNFASLNKPYDRL